MITQGDIGGILGAWGLSDRNGGGGRRGGGRGKTRDSVLVLGASSGAATAERVRHGKGKDLLKEVHSYLNCAILTASVLAPLYSKTGQQ